MNDNPLKIINEIVAPDLTDERFSDSLNEAFALINDNFKKIVSAPIYRGQQGENTKIKEVVILDGDQFTDEGKKIVKVIFTDANLDEWDGGFDSLKTILAGINKYKPIGSKSAADYFKINDKILMFYLDNVEETLLAPAQLYIFQDKRIEDITGGVQEFEDVTCFVSFEWDIENKTYTYVKAEQFPTIAWSTAMGDYVWKINGQLTNIIAKGLKGADAHFYIPMFKAIPQGEHFWNAVAIYSGGDWQVLSDINTTELQNGMTSIVYILPDEGSEPSPSDTPTGIEITTINTYNPEIPSVILNRQGASIESKPLDVMMDEIRPSSESKIKETTPAALYIPADEVGGGAVTNIHALWRLRNQETCTEANFGYVKKNGTDININNGTTTLNIHNYSTIKFKQNGIEYGYIKVNDGNDKLKIGVVGAGNSVITINDKSLKMEFGDAKFWLDHTTSQPRFALLIDGNLGDNDSYKGIYSNMGTLYKSVIVKNINLEVTNKFAVGTGSMEGSNYASNKYFFISDEHCIIKTPEVKINSNLSTDNTISIGNLNSSAINIEGKNVNILGSNGISANINGGKLSLSGDGTGKISLTSNNGLMEIKDTAYNYTDVISVNNYMDDNDEKVDSTVIGGVIECVTGKTITTNDVNLNGWQWKIGIWRSEMKWADLMLYYEQCGHLAHLYGRVHPPDEGSSTKTDFFIGVNNLPNATFVKYYKHPKYGGVDGRWLIDTMMTNNTDTLWESTPFVWRDAAGGVREGSYPYDDPEGKKHGWIYLDKTSDNIIFITPDATKYYWFNVWYLV